MRVLNLFTFDGCCFPVLKAHLGCPTPDGCTGRAGAVCTGLAFGAGIIGRALGGGTGADAGRGFDSGGRACGGTGRALGGGLTKSTCFLLKIDQVVENAICFLRHLTKRKSIANQQGGFPSQLFWQANVVVCMT